MTKNQSANQSPDVSGLMQALAKAQGEIGDVLRDRTVTVQPRSGSAYQFKYATLAAIITAIKKPLSMNGIAFTQRLTHSAEFGYYVLTTTLHCGNQYISSETPLILQDGGNQQFGSALTYMKRYALAALVGVAPDEDDDGNIADGNEIKAMQEAINKTAPKVAPDPISSGAISVPLGDFTPVQISVPMLKDESGTDWMSWGKSFMELARQAPSKTALAEFEKLNDPALKNMERDAKKMYTNMGVALMKVREELEKLK